MPIILAIESSCDDTSAAIIADGKILSNCTANQEIHRLYGGVVPEMASRAHQINIVPVVEAAFQKAGVHKKDLSAVAFTRGPGLLGSLLVGVSFAKGLALSLGIPMIEVNHMQAHVIANLIDEPRPNFPFICLTVSGGHTQLIVVKNHLDMQLLGQTIDDAAGEAFDKSGKLLGLGYPAGPIIDRLAKEGRPIFPFAEPDIPHLDFSFSGLKTSILYFLQKQTKLQPNFVQENLHDLCASIQDSIIQFLMKKLKKAAKQTGIKEIAIAGGVSANSALRATIIQEGKNLGWNVYIPAFEYCTDNAAMIAMVAHYKYLEKDFVGQDITPLARYNVFA
jgi:N6-L-threonylcarbamoyladenine synthase